MIAILEAGSYVELMNLPMDEFMEVRKCVMDIASRREKAMKRNA